MYTVYALLDPLTKNVRYIGYTKVKLSARLTQHYCDVRRKVVSHKAHWLKSLKKRALIVAIEEGLPTLSEATERERFWIAQYSNLTNSTTGGEISKSVKAEVREKLSKSHKLLTSMNGYVNPMKGVLRPDLSQRNKSKVWSDNDRQLASNRQREKYSTEKYKELFVLSQKNRKPVCQMDAEGNVIKTYPSTAAVKKDGFGSKEVQYCCIGKHSQHKGYIWKYETNLRIVIR